VSLHVVEGGGAAAGPQRRILAPGAPPSPGPLPLEWTSWLEPGEAVVFWNRRDHADLRGAAAAAGLVLAVLAGATVIVPELWSRPLVELWKPLAALASPVALLLLREWSNRGGVAVTDGGILWFPRTGRADRVSIDGVRRVRRDYLRGGVVLEGAAHRVRVPPALESDTRSAIAAARRGRLRSGTQPDDPLDWLP
jgi:hypothetical protein